MGGKLNIWGRIFLDGLYFIYEYLFAFQEVSGIVCWGDKSKV